MPAVFAPAYSASSYMLWPTPTRAARWKTLPTPSSARATSSGLRTSPAISSTSSEVLRPLDLPMHLPDKAVQCAHPVAGPYELVREVGADEPGPAGDENGLWHRSPFPRVQPPYR